MWLFLFEPVLASEGGEGLASRGIGIDPFSSQSLPLGGRSSTLFCCPLSILVMDDDSDAVDDLEEKEETEAEESDILLGDERDEATGGEEDRELWIKSESSVLGSPTDQSTSKTAERYELRNWGSSADLGRDVDMLSRDGVFGDDDDLGALGIGVGNEVKEWGEEGGVDFGGNSGGVLALSYVCCADNGGDGGAESREDEGEGRLGEERAKGVDE